MRVTKTMKEYVQKEFDKKRYAANEAYRAPYYAKHKACLEELRELVNEAREKSEVILAKYGMDSVKAKREKSNGYFSRELISLYDQYAHCDAELENIRKHEQKLAEYQREKLERFYLECDLGCDKDSFFEMVAALNFDNV